MTEIDMLPCVDCGAAVSDPKRTVKIQASAREESLGQGAPIVIQTGTWEYSATRDDTCQSRLWRAEAIAEEHPGVVRKLGSKQYAIDMIDAALIGLVNLHKTPDEWEKFTHDDRSLLRLVRRLAPVAANLRWSSDLSPVTRFGADAFYTERGPWQHLTDERTQALRDAFVPVLWDQLGLPRKIVPPEDGLRGCLYCGIDHIDVPADAGEEVWGELVKVNPATHGGRPSPDSIRGYLCAICRDAVETVGVMGPRALALAFMKHLRVTAPVPDFWLPGLEAWAVFGGDGETNATPWGHISDQADVKSMILGAGRPELEAPHLEGKVIAKVR